MLHDGERAWPEALEVLDLSRRHGLAVVLISNAPRPQQDVRLDLERFGIPDRLYHHLVTSGDVTLDLVRTHIDRRPATRIFHLGPERDLPLLAGFADRLTPSADDADLCVCTGLFDELTETPDDYRPLYDSLRAQGIPMICANPDETVERGERLVYCAGALANAYAATGGKVIYAGKPHSAIYEKAFTVLERRAGMRIPHERILCVGDNAHTDMAGARRLDLDAVFIASRLHFPDLSPRTPLTCRTLGPLFGDIPQSQLQIAALPKLAW